MQYYPSKLLLFGEYILLLGARALATPVPMFRGYWSEKTKHPREEQSASLAHFAQSAHIIGLTMLDSERFQKDVAEGLRFESNIPQGYGLGSSGALCAGVYDRYAFTKTGDLSELKGIFAQMESYFHGKSSGVDPLTSYLNKPLWVENHDSVRMFEASPWEDDAPAIFLLDTSQERQTGPLVEWFLSKCQQPDFTAQLKKLLFPFHETMLEAWQTRSVVAFWSALKHVSEFQLDFMPPMIPEHLRPAWANCLSGDDTLLKICGAGGGGFMLGFTKNKLLALERFEQYRLTFPFEHHDLVEK